MSLNRVMRYLGGLVIATILLAVILPLAGIPSSKFLPPGVAYGKATGIAVGVITDKIVQPTGNPFKVGDHVYLLNYKFKAPEPPPRGQTMPGPAQVHLSQIRVDEGVWGDMDQPKKSGVQPGQLIKVRYEKTYPDINGIVKSIGYSSVDMTELGRGCGPGSNILSGWLLFLLGDLALAYVLMMLVLERFGKQENI